MRNFILTAAIFFTGLNLVTAQSFQATAKHGSKANSVILAIKPSATLTARVGSISFSLGIPSSFLPRPTISLTTNFNTKIAYTFQNDSSLLDGVIYYIYNIAGDGDAGTTGAASYTAGVDNNMLEIEFNQSPTTTQMATIRLINRIGGGPLGQAYFYISDAGSDRTNYPALFYGIGAVNAGGVTSEQNSYLPLTNVSLPTKFLSFFATKNADVANLTWTVDNEENNNYFEVERSLDGRNFSKAYQVQALHNGRSSNSYTTPDADISRLGVKVIYYRIKQVEASGTIVYSEIRQVSLTDKNFSASLYPNPVKTSTKLVIDAPEAGKANVVIRDAAGKTVKTISLQLVKGINQQQLDASLFAAGDYNVTIVSEKLNQTIKMTKAN